MQVTLYLVLQLSVLFYLSLLKQHIISWFLFRLNTLKCTAKAPGVDLLRLRP